MPVDAIEQCQNDEFLQNEVDNLLSADIYLGFRGGSEVGFRQCDKRDRVLYELKLSECRFIDNA